MPVVNLSRRAAVAGLGGLVLGLALPGCAASTPPVDHSLGMGPTPTGPDTDLNAWIRIAPNGVVTFQVGAAEMGQGAMTALPMILAEELDVPWEQVRAESAPAHEAYGRKMGPVSVQLTGGSATMVGYTPMLQQIGATARGMLIAAAARQWEVDPAECRAEQGAVLHGDKKATYGELAELAALEDAVDATPKDRAEYRLVGKSPPRLDLPAKVDGSAQFATDFQHPDMLVAVPRICPHYGGRVSSLADDKALAMPGVQGVFVLEERIVVAVATSFWQARQAVYAVEIEWDAGEGEGLDDAEISRRMHEGLGQGRTLFSTGKPKLPEGSQVIEATYEVPYLAHAVMEPLSATAWVQPERVDLWVGTQAQSRDHKMLVKQTGLSPEQCFVHTLFLGGGLGRRSASDWTQWAVQVAQNFEVPVKLQFDREATFAASRMRPAMVCRQRAVLGDDGLPTHWLVELSGPHHADQILPKILVKGRPAREIVVGGMADHLPYACENREVVYNWVDLPITTHWWRSVHGSTNGFFREAFVDELAAAAGIDPIEYRRRLLADQPRHLKVFEAALEAAGQQPPGTHRGVACFESFGSLAAEVLDIRVEDSGRIQPVHAGAAIDCGTAVHVDTVKAQVMGGLLMGLSAALYEKVSFQDGRGHARNYPDYPLLRMDQAPTVNVTVIESGEEMGGVGEPGLPPIAGALANALYNARGERVRKLPIMG
ncbi:MAG: molybdopterin cofactor-binding domain-containing protein [Myxococcota bacterium]|nr:molybdopterin cofactor-binding domain-containing protein [Myxococcota bacterium]